MYNDFMDRLYNKINVHSIDVIEDMSDVNVSVRSDILNKAKTR